MGHLHAEAAKRNANKISLRVHPDNSAARCLYERRGYARVGEADGQWVFEHRLPSHRCVVCSGELRPRWTDSVLQGRYQADYCQCERCGSLQIADPFWLAEAYAGESLPSAGLADPGRVRRNMSAFGMVYALCQGGLIDPAAAILDFGGGSGLLTRLLLDSGFDAWTCDLHVPVPLFAGERVLSSAVDFGTKQFGLVTAFEVLEHLTDPVPLCAALRRQLRPGGVLLLSTSLYRPEFGPDWHYLAPDFGQHVVFWTEQAIHWVAETSGFTSVVQITSGELDVFLLSDFAEAQVRAGLERASGLQQHPGFADGLLKPLHLAELSPQPPIANLKGDDR